MLKQEKSRKRDTMRINARTAKLGFGPRDHGGVFASSIPRSHAQGIWYIHLYLVISSWPAQVEAKSMIYTSGHGPSFGTFKCSEHADPLALY